MRLSERKFRGLRFGVFEADLESHELRKHGLRIKLTGQPFQALTLLLERSGELVTRDDLRQALWPNEPWGNHDQRLNKIVNKIRDALCDSAEGPRYLETVPRMGYRFLLNVEPFGELTNGNGLKLETVATTEIAPSTEPVVKSEPLVKVAAVQRILSTLRWWGLAGVLASLLLVATIANRPLSRRADTLKIFEPAPLTTYVGSELYPSISPDGKQVVFAWDGGARKGSHIYTTPVSGGSAKTITEDARNDYNPVWSFDGQEIAYLRDAGLTRAEVWIVHSDGTGARKLREISRAVTDQSLAWLRGGNWLIAAEQPEQNGPSSLFVISTKTGEQRPLATPSGALAGDASPAVSPDGMRLAFTRATSGSWRDIHVVHMSSDQRFAGEPVRLTDARTIIGPMAWTPDSRSIVFSAATTAAGSRHLSQLVDASPGVKSAIKELGIEGDYPAIARTGLKLVYVRKNLEQSSIWRLELDSASSLPRQVRMVSSTRRDFTTDLASDGVHLVFSSVRSGPSEIWMSEKDGSNLRRLTSIGGSTPRWSPDGKRIVFESNHRGQPEIYVLTISTESVLRLTSDQGSNLRPSWSRDGRYVYFGSNRTGKSQIWKVPSSGGDAVQITRRGGIYAVETFDGNSIYYTTPDLPSAVWTTSANGGDETEVIRDVVGYSTIAMARDGLYFLSSLTRVGAQLDLLKFKNGATRRLATIDRPVHRFLSSSPDGRSVLYTQVDREDSDLMVIDPFH